DVVALDGVTGDPRLTIPDRNSPAPVAGDDVARPGRRAADGDVGDLADALTGERTVPEANPITLIGHSSCARGVGADEIALHGDVRDKAPASMEIDALCVIAGDDVAGTGRRATDGAVPHVRQHDSP